MLGKTAEGFLLKMLKTIRTTDLEEALMVLPFDHITRFLHFLDIFIKKVRFPQHRKLSVHHHCDCEKIVFVVSCRAGTSS